MIEIPLDKLLAHIGQLYVEREEYRTQFESTLKRLGDEVATLQAQSAGEVEDDDAPGGSGDRTDTPGGGAE